MNETLKTLFARKSVRAYTEEPITVEERKIILKAAAEAPTAGNMSLYSIIEVQDPALKELLAERCDHQPFIAKAPLVLLFVVDWQKWIDLFHHFGMEPGELTEADFLLAAQDAMAAAENAVLAAESMGIGSCYIGDILEYAEENIETFRLPPMAAPFAMLVFGRPAPAQQTRKKALHFAPEELLSVDCYRRREGEELLEMFTRHSGAESPEELETWATALAKRKFFCGFREEMIRSCRAILRHFTAQNKK